MLTLPTFKWECLFFTETSECASPAEVFNAYHDGPPGQITFKLGTMLQYKCESGYTLSRDAVVRAWCVGGGAWVGPNMTCSRNYYPINTSFVNTETFYHIHLKLEQGMTVGQALFEFQVNINLVYS